MFTTPRQTEIMRLVRAKQTCTVAELAQLFAVSDETVRRTVKPLIADGLLVKVHGGVMLPDRLDEPPFQRRLIEQRDAKQSVAASVCELVQDGDSLILDSGTTCVHIADALCTRSRLTVVTNSVEIARTLAPCNGNRVFVAGGELRADDLSAVGDEVLAFIKRFHVRFAIVSVTAIDHEGRFMDAQLSDVSYSLAAFAQAEQRIVAADHAKFGHSALAHAFGPTDIDVLVTDEAPPPAIARAFSEAGLEVRVGRPSAVSGDGAAVA